MSARWDSLIGRVESVETRLRSLERLLNAGPFRRINLSADHASGHESRFFFECKHCPARDTSTDPGAVWRFVLEHEHEEVDQW